MERWGGPFDSRSISQASRAPHTGRNDEEAENPKRAGRSLVDRPTATNLQTSEVPLSRTWFTLGPRRSRTREAGAPPKGARTRAASVGRDVGRPPGTTAGSRDSRPQDRSAALLFRSGAWSSEERPVRPGRDSQSIEPEVVVGKALKGRNPRRASARSVAARGGASSGARASARGAVGR